MTSTKNVPAIQDISVLLPARSLFHQKREQLNQQFLRHGSTGLSCSLQKKHEGLKSVEAANIPNISGEDSIIPGFADHYGTIWTLNLIAAMASNLRAMASNLIAVVKPVSYTHLTLPTKLEV